MLTPVMSPGRRSGVNCTRLLLPCTLCAMARAREVLPVPGKSSSRRWPSLRSEVKESLITKVLPSSTCSTLETSRLKMSENQAACSGVIVMLLPLVVPWSLAPYSMSFFAASRLGHRGRGRDLALALPIFWILVAADRRLDAQCRRALGHDHLGRPVLPCPQPDASRSA